MTIIAQKILIVDDDLDFRESLRDALLAESYALVEARDGSEALSYLRAQAAPVLILLDWNMAPMSGPQFMEEFAKTSASSRIPVILLTADARVSEKALQLGFSDVLRKPFELDKLLALIEGYCEA